jgi:2-polyprenyl-3-methyl-5-hydroxy-6-metoxy-1,4-benzoquinol methylase
MDDDAPADTSGEWYAERLVNRRSQWWRRFVPDPYRWNIRRSRLGRVLDIGCGVGRCLEFNGGVGIGVDHNPTSVALCRRRGLEAYTPEEFAALDPGLFDSMLLSHVLEHTTPEEGRALLTRYLSYVRPGGTVMLITPQRAGQRSDPSHVRPLGRAALRGELEALGLVDLQTRSFPFPAVAGRWFRHNENQAIGHLPGAG